VRATIVVNLIASGAFSAAERQTRLDAILRDGAPATKAARAEAIGRRSAIGFDTVLIALARDGAIEVKVAALVAMGRVKSAALLPSLVLGLVDEATRPIAEQVLSELGEPAFAALEHRFEDVTTDAGLRWRIPPALLRCNPERTMQSLLHRLPNEPDGSVRFQVVRTLERLIRKHPSLPVDRTALAAAISETMARAFRYLNARLLLVRGAAERAERRTAGHDLRRDLSRDKDVNARGRLFRLLVVLHPTDDFAQIYRGLGSSREPRETSMELIESILKEPLRSAVAGPVDDGDDQLRLASAGPYHRVINFDYEALLAYLVDGDGDTLREVAHFHAAALGIADRLREIQVA
jgi:hypothetical protein